MLRPGPPPFPPPFPFRSATACAFALALLAAFSAAPAGAAGAGAPAGDGDAPPTVRERLADLPLRDGLLRLYPDAGRGRLWAVLPPAGKADRPGGGVSLGRYLLIESLAAGLGSNPVGLDRGQLGRSRVVELVRRGPAVWIEEPNLGFRADGGDASERAAVRESFARSVLWSGPVGGADADGTVAVDLAPLLTSDLHGIARTLKAGGQGAFAVDSQRSAVDLDGMLVFPDNVEVDAHLTFAGAEPGDEVRSVVPTAGSITLIQHVSFVRLPDDGYAPRELDPRSGAYSVDHVDYATPLDAPTVRRWAVRHRMRDADGAVRPLIYHVDRGVPEPVRSALIEGASWWAEAFAAAGFPGAFRVELLPEGVHPLDARYNVIQWVHRATRGWSYGGGAVDPRTGECIKAHVNLGSLRVRQDRLLFEGLLGADGTGSGRPDDPVQLALARIRQLAAHEVGHTLGLNHNFAASTYGGRASVMDYPAPLLRVAADGTLDVSQAYGTGVGAWDVQAIRWLYGEQDAAARSRLLDEGSRAGRIYLTDRDARPDDAADPRANLWDNGADPVAELDAVFRVRRWGLDRFGPDRVRPGAPLATLEEVFVPLYLHHRYQLRAAARSIGGIEYGYALRGDPTPPMRPVAAVSQRAALRAVLRGLDPAELEVPDAALAAIAPRPPGYPPHPELFESRIGPAFDPLAAAIAAADLVYDELLAPGRAARMEELHRRDAQLPDFAEVADALVAAVVPPKGGELPRRAGIRRAVRDRQIDRFIALAENPRAVPAVREQAERVLDRLRPFAPARIERFLARGPGERTGALPDAGVPPGSPIGMEAPGCSRDDGNDGT